MTEHPRAAAQRRWALALGVAALCVLAAPVAYSTPELPPWWSAEQRVAFQPRTAEEAFRQVSQAFASPPDLPAAQSRADQSYSLGRLVSTDVRWNELSPPLRFEHALLYDSRRDRMLAIGGSLHGPARDVWALSLDAPMRWTQILSSAVGPGLILNGAAVYDSLNDRVIAYEAGVYQGGTAALWLLDLSQSSGWQLVTGASTGIPTGAPSVAWDGASGHVLLVSSGVISRFDLAHPSGWEQVVTTGPTPSHVTFDPARRRLYGTSTGGGAWFFDLDGPADWTEIAPPWTTGYAWTRIAFDRVSGRLLIVDEHESTWSIDPETGSVDPLVTVVWGHPWFWTAVAVDPLRHRLIHSGGWDSGRGNTSCQARSLELDAPAGWHDVGPWSGGARMWHHALLDAPRDRILVEGGWVSFTLAETLIVRPLADPAAGALPYHPSPGPRPRPRFGQAFVLDTIDDRALLFGGQATDGTGDYLGDVWALTLTDPPVWQPISVAGGPGPLRFADVFFDPRYDRMVVMGGDDGVNVQHRVWELRLNPAPVWNELTVVGQYPDFFGGCFFDPGDGLAWGLGRMDSLTQVRFTESQAIFDPAPVAYSVTPGAPRTSWMWLDPERNTIVGFRNPVMGMPKFGTMIEIHLGSPATMDSTTVAGPPPHSRYLHSVVLDPSRSQAVLYGGYDDLDKYFDDWYALSVDQAVPVEVAVAGAEVRGGAVYVSWQVHGTESGSTITIERRGNPGPWTSWAGETHRDSDRLSIVDDSVTPSRQYAYRLAIHEAGDVRFAGEVEVTVPAALAFRLMGPTHQPVDGDLRVRFTLAEAGAATLDLFDVAGRRMVSRRLQAAPAGDREETLAPRGTLVPGVYVVRLGQNGKQALGRVVVVR